MTVVLRPDAAVAPTPEPPTATPIETAEPVAAPAADQPASGRRSRSERVVGVDIARGLAMLGMITVHVTVGSNEAPGRIGSWLLEAPSGRASVLFFTLSGLALSLVARRGSASAQTSVLLKRGALLLVGGWFVLSTIWPGSILHQYGAMFLLAPVLLRRRSRTLLIAATATFAVGPVLAKLGPWALGSWGQGRYGVHGWLLNTLSNSLFSLYALVVWAGFFMVGMVLGRLRLTTRQGAAMLLAGSAACAGVTLAGSWLGQPTLDATDGSGKISSSFSGVEATGLGGAVGEITPIDAADVDTCEEAFQWEAQWYGADGTWNGPTDPADSPTFDTSACYPKYERGSLGDQIDRYTFTDLSPHGNTTLWALQAQSIAVAVLGLCLILPRLVKRALWPVAALGSISLTAYVLHMALVQDLWTVLGSADADAGLMAQFGTLMAIWAVELVVASFICWRFRRGPMEWLLAQFSSTATVPAAPQPTS